MTSPNELTRTRIIIGVASDEEATAFIEALENQAKNFKAAVQEFVDRCDSGEFRSTHTYQRFKDVLDGKPFDPVRRGESGGCFVTGCDDPVVRTPSASGLPACGAHLKRRRVDGEGRN